MYLAHQAVPTKLNICLVLSVQLVLLLLMYIACSVDLIWSIPLGILFSFIMLTNYALMHEGTHYNLQPSPNSNWLLGMVCGWLFPMSFTMYEVTHQVHHKCNRTDHEMFDYYYPYENKFLKQFVWFGILLGPHWALLPIGSILLSIFPFLFNTKLFRAPKTSEVLFTDFNKTHIRKVRIEVILGILYWIVLFQVLSLRWETLAIFYAFFAFNWSTRQYLTHAFTPRDVMNGALNLKVSKPMGLLLLNGNWDLVHHQNPELPWTLLPKYANKSSEPVSSIRQYLKLWRGIQPNPEPAPCPLHQIDPRDV